MASLPKPWMTAAAVDIVRSGGTNDDAEDVALFADIIAQHEPPRDRSQCPYRLKLLALSSEMLDAMTRCIDGSLSAEAAVDLMVKRTREAKEFATLPE